MKTFKFKRPSGRILEVNESSYAHCVAQGWELVEDTKPAPKRTKKAKTDGNSEKSN